MGLSGSLALFSILALGGEILGPMKGGLLSLAGFGPFGNNPFYAPPVVLSVMLASLSKPWALPDSFLQYTALFATNLAPVAGRLRRSWGGAGGCVHPSTALLVAPFQGSLNLNNNGFTAGIVDRVFISVILALEPASDRHR
jgi:hypothetical protein